MYNNNISFCVVTERTLKMLTNTTAARDGGRMRERRRTGAFSREKSPLNVRSAELDSLVSVPKSLVSANQTVCEDPVPDEAFPGVVTYCTLHSDQYLFQFCMWLDLQK